MRSNSRVLSSKTVFKGRVITVKVEEVVEPGRIKATREVVCHSGSVVVLPHLHDGRLLLVRQYRHAAGQALWELVAGGMERGESPQEAARRELLEEAGYRARSLTPLFNFFPSPGVLTERMHLVEARGLTLAQARPEPDERIRVGRFTRRQWKEMLEARKIKDGKTLAGLYWLLSKYPQGR
ncbi:MAG TPA: NUDIX hydrolase [Terriglobia bacterium]|nr:NUDIX hydrolase [Terriglobia bacterium]